MPCFATDTYILILAVIEHWLTSVISYSNDTDDNDDDNGRSYEDGGAHATIFTFKPFHQQYVLLYIVFDNMNNYCS